MVMRYAFTAYLLSIRANWCCLLQIDKKSGPERYTAGSPEPRAHDGSGLGRRPSQRQQEKAPEGRAPHVGALDDGAGPAATEEGEAEPSQSHGGAASSPGQAPIESRFTEGL